ncbi:MAG: class I SAM-dependent methyltransferase [Thiomicrorhabdus sp.]|jgi:SAM-dependent methyltransferase|nr:class I SAM-dependent methyltransferase [Thiomicrorhabdus sp.]
MALNLFMLKVTLVKALVSEETLTKQSRKPSGWLGKNILQPMFVKGNADLNQFILELMTVQVNEQVLEIGFGPGELLFQLCQQSPSAQFTGLDFSPLMLQQASVHTQRYIKSGQLALIEASSDNMPFANYSFHQVACANTLYFWQPPEPHFKEVLRVLKPGGKFVLGFRTGEQIDRMQLHPTIFARYTEEEVGSLLELAGFENIRIESRAGFPVDSVCAVAYKPSYKSIAQYISLLR